MEKRIKYKGKAMTIPGGLAISVLTSVVITFVLSAVLSLLLLRQVIPEERSGYFVMLLLLLASLSGGVTAATKIKHQILMVCMLSGILYWTALMLVTILFFGGKFAAVGETAIMILLGTVMAAGLCLKKIQTYSKK